MSSKSRPRLEGTGQTSFPQVCSTIPRLARNSLLIPFPTSIHPHPPPPRAEEKGRLPGELKPRRKQGRGKAPWHTGCSWQLGARRPPVLPQASPLPWIMPTGCGSGERRQQTRGSERYLFSAQSLKGQGESPLGSRVLEQASSQFQLSWSQELLRPAALCGGCYLPAGEHPVAVVTQGSTRQEASHKARSRALPAVAWP